MSLLSEADLTQFLESSSEIPTDVTFRIINEEGEVEAEVKAHKIHLAEVSPVFRRGFYGIDNTDKLSGEVDIQETSKTAFQSLISLIYKNDPVSTTLKNLSFDDIFQVANLAERYQIQTLMEKVETYFKTVDLDKWNKTFKNEPVDKAIRSSHRFHPYDHLQKPVNALLLNCAKTIQFELENKEDLLKYLKRLSNLKQEEEVLCLSSDSNIAGPKPPYVDPAIIMKLVTTLADLPSLCQNCKSNPCLDGHGVEKERLFTKVRPNPVYLKECWEGKSSEYCGEGIITSITKYVGFTIIPASSGSHFDRNKWYTISNRGNGETDLVFSCKCLDHKFSKSCTKHLSVLK